MSQYPNPYAGSRGPRGGDMLGYESQANTLTVAQFFNTVYAWMCVGLAVTAVVGWYVSHSMDALRVVYATKGTYLVIGLIAFGIAWYVQSQAGKLSVGVATALFLAYAAIIGALISGIFIIYPAKTLAASFVVTGGVFGSMSLYGFVTKRDLTAIGSTAIMIFWGFILASIVNIWLASTALDWIITYGVLALFIAITAYQTQRLRQIAVELSDNPEMAHRYAIVGSLVLYIAFINLFLSILRILGNSRR
jgi:FtsH-binding integral membrane protein